MKRLRIPLLCALVLPATPLFAEDAAGFQAAVELNANRGAFEFDGLGPGIDLGKSNIVTLSGSDFTIHAWVKLAADCNDSGAGSWPPCDMSIVDKMASADSVNNYGWRLLKQSDGHFWFCLGGGPGNGCDGSVNTTVIGRTVAVTGVWYSVVAVKTSRQISIYVNGVLEGTSLLRGLFLFKRCPCPSRRKHTRRRLSRRPGRSSSIIQVCTQWSAHSGSIRTVKGKVWVLMAHISSKAAVRPIERQCAPAALIGHLWAAP